MTASNIQQFDEITGRVLGALYERFPVPHRLMISDFMNDGFSMNDHLGIEVPNEVGMFFIASVDWLADAGYLKFRDKVQNVGYLQAILTAKGLEALKSTPASLTSGPSLGDQLVDATKSGTKSILGSIAGEVLSVGSRLVTSHFGLPS